MQREVGTTFVVSEEIFSVELNPCDITVRMLHGKEWRQMFPQGHLTVDGIVLPFTPDGQDVKGELHAMLEAAFEDDETAHWWFFVNYGRVPSDSEKPRMFDIVWAAMCQRSTKE